MKKGSREMSRRENCSPRKKGLLLSKLLSSHLSCSCSALLACCCPSESCLHTSLHTVKACSLLQQLLITAQTADSCSIYQFNCNFTAGSQQVAMHEVTKCQFCVGSHLRKQQIWQDLVARSLLTSAAACRNWERISLKTAG